MRQARDGKAVTEVAFCRDRLANYQCPASVDFVAELPRNATGKVLRDSHGIVTPDPVSRFSELAVRFTTGVMQACAGGAGGPVGYAIRVAVR